MNALATFIEGRKSITLPELKAECIRTGGQWGPPDEVDARSLIEISLHGVSAIDYGPEAVCRNWLKAAQTVVAWDEVAA